MEVRVLTLLPSLALALDIDPRGRWVERGEVSVGDAEVGLEAGILFPVTDGERAVGFVFVGDASFSTPVRTSGEALSVRAAVPDLELRAGERWAEATEVVLGVGLREELLRATTLGHALGTDPRTVTFVDETGREQVLVTALTPRQALDRAQAALGSRSRSLRAAGLDLDAMLAREAWREGEPRAIVEVRPEHDLGPLIGAIDDTADLGRTWLTWVVDPTGLVHDRYGQVLAVHGPGADGHAWRPLTGVPRTSGPAWSATGAELNLVLDAPIGTAAKANTEVRLKLRAGEGGRWVDLWIPRTESSERQGQIVVGGDPELTLATLADGTPLLAVDLPFGPRTPGSGWIVRSWLLPEPVEEGATVALRLDWWESWDVAGMLEAKVWVSYQLKKLGLLEFQPEIPPGVPELLSLGPVNAGLGVLPRSPTGPVGYPAEVRAGTLASAYQMSVGGGTQSVEHGDGRLWVGEVHGATTISAGRLSEDREAAVGQFPAIRLLQHSLVFDRHMPERIRAVLHFYGTALPAWPHREVVVIQGQDHPVMQVVTDPRRVPNDPQSPPTVRAVGQGQIVLEGVVAIPVTESNASPVRAVRAAFPHAAERGLAEALAAGWWEDLAWSEQDRWLSRALPKVYRDRFVEEAWGAKVADTWSAQLDARLAREAPSEGLQSLVGTNAEWADELGARFLGRAVAARIGEPRLLEGLARFQASGEPTLERLVTELEAVSKTPLRDSFDAFVVAGLRPTLDGTWEVEGDRIRVRLTADVPVGTYDVPVVATGRRGPTTSWIRVVDGRGEGVILVSDPDIVEIDPGGHLPLRGRALREREALATEVEPSADPRGLDLDAGVGGRARG